MFGLTICGFILVVVYSSSSSLLLFIFALIAKNITNITKIQIKEDKEINKTFNPVESLFLDTFCIFLSSGTAIVPSESPQRFVLLGIL